MRIRVSETELAGVVLIDTDYARDERGFFIESWNRRTYADAGLDVDFVQDNHSRSRRAVLRGLHWQDMTAPLVKLVRCTTGAIYDVAVDLRSGSPTFGRWIGAELSAENMRQVWIPVGFAHGFAVLTEVADVQYKCSGYYAPAAEGCLRWDDPELGIEWPVAAPTVSAKDAAGMSFADYRDHPDFR